MSLLVDALKSKYANLESIQALLESGDFFLDYQDPETGGTALFYALDRENEELALELIELGANVELAEAEGVTPLMAACCLNFHSAAEAIALRVRNIEVTDNNGLTALSYAAQCSSLEIFQLLVHCGALVETAVDGVSIFHQALAFGRVDTAEYLLTEFEFFSVHHRDAYGNQPMHWACSGGHLNAVEWLHRRGAGCDELGFCSRTPLMFTAHEGHILVAQKLLLWGADPHRADDEGKTARTWAMDEGYGGVVTLLDAWSSVQAMWVVRFAGEVRRVAPGSEFKRLPYDMNRMLGNFLV
jgi:ankyrin repeat protein